MDRSRFQNSVPRCLATALVGLLILGSPSVGVAGDSPDARAIMEKVEEASRLPTAEVTTLLKTSGGGKEDKIKKFLTWRKLKEDGIFYKTLSKFSSPADIAGIAILVIEEKENQNDINMYLPAFKKTRRVEGSQQSGSFMGTVFSYADIATFHAVNYKYQYLAQEACPGDPAHSCHVIQLEPPAHAMRNRTGYSRMKDWVRVDLPVVVQSDCWDLRGKLSKRITMSDFREAGEKSGRWIAYQTEARNLENQRTSLLVNSSVKMNADVPESLFVRGNLSR